MSEVEKLIAEIRRNVGRTLSSQLAERVGGWLPMLDAENKCLAQERKKADPN